MKVKNAIKQCNENREFYAFLLLDQGPNLMTNNSLPVHIESGDILFFFFFFFL